MNRTIITMILAATMATGCATDPMIDGSGPSLETMEGTNGSPGNNGLLVTTFQAQVVDLIDLTTEALFTNITELTLKPDVIAFLASPDGREVFGYAIQCALPETKTIKYGPFSYKGAGILTTTAQWRQQGLNDAAKGDLFACIAAHLNPLEGASVPIFLSGPSVDQKAGSALYPVKEALWTAEVGEVGVTYHVWPLFTVPEMCAADPYAALYKRVCGQDPVACFLQLHPNTTECMLQTPINEDDGQVVCLGKPAIMTRLKSEDFLPALYPSCFPIPM